VSSGHSEEEVYSLHSNHTQDPSGLSILADSPLSSQVEEEDDCSSYSLFTLYSPAEEEEEEESESSLGGEGEGCSAAF